MKLHTYYIQSLQSGLRVVRNQSLCTGVSIRPAH